MQPWKMREAILAAYPNSPTWPEKVKKMSDSQVTAVYFRLLGKGLIK